MSFFADKVVCEGLTFDDVWLIPSYSEVLPREVELSSWFTRHIRIHMPVVTAAMDTVTDSKMAHQLYQLSKPIVNFAITFQEI
ncbi:MAG TPA: IMP dehydrogenase [Prolixibacteraceae bacterium]|nr:IMP dehydrogenase [Prolixibacteraceae bacterium]